MKDLCETYLKWYRYIPWGQTTAAYCPSSSRIKPVKDKGQAFSICSIENTYHMEVLYFVKKEKKYHNFPNMPLRISLKMKLKLCYLEHPYLKYKGYVEVICTCTLDISPLISRSL